MRRALPETKNEAGQPIDLWMIDKAALESSVTRHNRYAKWAKVLLGRGFEQDSDPDQLISPGDIVRVMTHYIGNWPGNLTPWAQLVASVLCLNDSSVRTTKLRTLGFFPIVDENGEDTLGMPSYVLQGIGEGLI
jgi:hypothetical protein